MFKRNKILAGDAINDVVLPNTRIHSLNIRKSRNKQSIWLETFYAACTALAIVAFFGSSTQKFTPSKIDYSIAPPANSVMAAGRVAGNNGSNKPPPPPPPPPLPYIIVGMPKSGTTTIHDYFQCGKAHRTSHFICKGHTHACATCLPNVCAVCMRDNFIKNGPSSPLMEGCGDWDVYTELDACMMLKNPQNPVCYYPQVTDLEGIHASHPGATFILNLRNVDRWIGSVGRFKDLSRCLVNCDIDGVLPKGKGAKPDELRKFYNDQTERVREFVKLHPTHKLVEVNIEDEKAGHYMESIFGVAAKCWGHANKNMAKPR